MSRVLVIDNDFAERAGRALVMEFGGHRCEMAESLQEAVAHLQRATFDLVLMDSALGEESAVHAVGILKRICPSVAVIVLSERTEAVEGADNVLTIPCSPSDLFQRTDHLMQRIEGPGNLRQTSSSAEEPYPNLASNGVMKERILARP